MKRIFIFEGPDGCGKSVAASRLAARRSPPAILTRHGPYAGERDVWRRYLAAMLPAYAGLADVILDRSWLSEPIYGTVYRGGANRIAPWQRRMLERVALGRGATVVLARTAWERCAENFALRKAEGGEMLEDATQLRAVYDAYAELELASLFPASTRVFTESVALYDYAAERPLDLPETATNPGPGIGRWAPRAAILLVGDRPGGDGDRSWLPFVSLTADGCSAWLAAELETAGIPECALYWVNAHDGCQPTAGAFAAELAPRAVVALGDAAEAWCLENLASSQIAVFEKVPHPQRWKRFHAGKSYPLIEVLTSCLSQSHPR